MHYFIETQNKVANKVLRGEPQDEHLVTGVIVASEEVSLSHQCPFVMSQVSKSETAK